MATMTMQEPSNLDDIAVTASTSNELEYDTLDGFAACFCCNTSIDNFLPEFVALQGQAFDAIVVQSTTTDRVAASDFLINFDHPSTPFPPSPRSSADMEQEGCQALLEVQDEAMGKVYFPIDYDHTKKKSILRQPPQCDRMKRSSAFKVADDCSKQDEAMVEQGTLRLLAKMLKPGKNSVRYLFNTEQKVLGVAPAYVFLWSDQDRMVVCDVDGTITRSNVRGIYDTLVTESYMYSHDSVCHSLTAIKNSGMERSLHENPQEHSLAPTINILYLSSRPYVLAQKTKRFLSNIRQTPEGEEVVQKRRRGSGKSYNINGSVEMTVKETQSSDEHHRLPEGPFMGYPGKLAEVLKMELVTHDVHKFKAAAIMEQVVTPFCKVSDNPQDVHKSLFVAGFGNTFMDVQAYHMAGIELSQIYLIDKKSRIHCMDAWETQKQQEPSPQQSKRKSWRTTKLDSHHTVTIMDESRQLEEENKEDFPMLKTPMSKKGYKKQMGTVFEGGYGDENLVSHVCLRGRVWQ